MKKVLFLLFALMAVMTVQAQSICGSWQLMQPFVQNDGDGYVMITYIHTFNEDGTFFSDADITYSSRPAQTKAREVALSGTIRGTYTLEGDQLKMNGNVNTLNLDLVSLSENGKVIYDSKLKSNLKSMLNKEAKAKLAEQINNETYTVSVTAGGQMLELTKKDGTVVRLMRMALMRH